MGRGAEFDGVFGGVAVLGEAGLGPVRADDPGGRIEEIWIFLQNFELRPAGCGNGDGIACAAAPLPRAIGCAEVKHTLKTTVLG